MSYGSTSRRIGPDGNEKLTELDFVADVLKSMKLIIWGEYALGYLGVGTIYSEYMLGIVDNEFNRAIQLLLSAGFKQQTWPYCSTLDPATVASDKYEAYCRIQENVAPGYRKLTQNSARFYYPDSSRCRVRVVLLPCSYIHLHVPENFTFSGGSTVEGLYKAIANVYYPLKSTMLESFIRVLLEDVRLGGWDSTLNTWIISYMYGQLGLGNDVLDGIEDAAVKEWWNKEIDREHGGMDMRDTKHDHRIP